MCNAHRSLETGGLYWEIPEPSQRAETAEETGNPLDVASMGKMGKAGYAGLGLVFKII